MPAFKHKKFSLKKAKKMLFIRGEPIAISLHKTCGRYPVWGTVQL